jgi:RNase P subunit RPR2
MKNVCLGVSRGRRCLTEKNRSLLNEIEFLDKFVDEDGLQYYEENVRNLMKVDPVAGGLYCKMCNKPYATPSSLSNHIELKHLKIVDYNCQYCGKVFKSKSHRAVHIHREHRADHRDYMDSNRQDSSSSRK